MLRLHSGRRAVRSTQAVSRREPGCHENSRSQLLTHPPGRVALNQCEKPPPDCACLGSSAPASPILACRCRLPSATMAYTKRTCRKLRKAVAGPAKSTSRARGQGSLPRPCRSTIGGLLYSLGRQAVVIIYISIYIYDPQLAVEATCVCIAACAACILLTRPLVRPITTCARSDRPAGACQYRRAHTWTVMLGTAVRPLVASLAASAALAALSLPAAW